VGVASGEDDVDHLGLLAKDLGDLFRVEHLVAYGVVDLVEHNEIPFLGENRLSGLIPGLPDHANVFGVGLGTTHFHKATPHLPDNDRGFFRSAERSPQSCHGIELAVMP
jgi:hypothetical protein